MTTKMKITRGILIAAFVLLTLENGGMYLSLSTALKTNQDASAKVVSDLNDKIETYRQESMAQNAILLEHVDTTQSGIQLSLDQSASLTEQNQHLLKGIDDQGKQLVDLAKEIKDISSNQTAILAQHTQSLKEQKESVRQAKDAAESAQLDSRRAIRVITKPKPKSWLSNIFSAPSPTPTPKYRHGSG